MKGELLEKDSFFKKLFSVALQHNKFPGSGRWGRIRVGGASS